MAKPVITGAWKKLIFINYSVDPGLLQSFVPEGTKLNLHNHTCYITLAGFVFSGIRLFQVPMIFHQHVPEINLRFYVIPENGSQKERGVVFLKEIISKPLMGLAANLFYGEKYSIWPVSKKWESKKVAYHWHQPRKQKISVRCSGKAYKPEAESHEEFIMMQYFGYTKLPKRKTLRYQVKHPVWDLYRINQVTADVDFGRCFGKRFKFLSKQKPETILLAEGSDIEIYQPDLLNKNETKQDRL